MATTVEQIASKFAQEAQEAQEKPFETAVNKAVKSEGEKRKESGVLRKVNIERMDRIYARLVENQWMVAYDDMAWLYMRLNESMVECDRLWKKCEELMAITIKATLKAQTEISPTAFNARRNY